MRITVVCAGKIKEKYLSAGIAEFMKRLRPFAQVEIREIHEEKMPDEPSAAEKEQVLHKEGEKLLKLVPAGSYLFVLDVYGTEMASEQLAAKMEHWRGQGRDLVFLIGGPEGHAAEVSALADEKWSIGPLTLPHMMVRLIVVEQLYRACAMLANHPYHRA